MKPFPRKGGVFIKSAALFAIKSTQEPLAASVSDVFTKPSQHPVDKLAVKKESQ